MSLSLSDRIRIPDDVMFRELDGESVLLNLKNETYYGLDNVGTRCWEHLAKSPSIGHVCNQVSKHYGINENRAQIDVIDLVKNLMDQGLVEVENGDNLA